DARGTRQAPGALNGQERRAAAGRRSRGRAGGGRSQRTDSRAAVYLDGGQVMNRLAKKYLRPSQIPTKACHGCGIGMIENWLLQAIDEMGLKQEDVIFGTGIGCVGRQTFATWGGDNFGATHGRALAVATGLKLAQPDKKYLIVVGDGDAASIGTSHLIHAARRNLGVTVVCEDNMGYESTGGQFSPTTPAGYVTNSSPYGMVEPGFDPCDVVKAAGATFVAETTATQWHQTVKVVKKALQNDGFSFVHVRFPCNENFGAYAPGSRRTLTNLEWIYEHTQGRKADGSPADFTWETGIKHDASNSRPEFTRLLRDMNARVRAEQERKQAAAGAGTPRGRRPRPRRPGRGRRPSAPASVARASSAWGRSSACAPSSRDTG